MDIVKVSQQVHFYSVIICNLYSITPSMPEKTHLFLELLEKPH